MLCCAVVVQHRRITSRLFCGRIFKQRVREGNKFPKYIPAAASWLRQTVRSLLAPTMDLSWSPNARHTIFCRKAQLLDSFQWGSLVSAESTEARYCSSETRRRRPVGGGKFGFKLVRTRV